ncbi:hypothetical protein BH10ACT2_BH10ACT2_13170 [soil metagenome]
MLGRVVLGRAVLSRAVLARAVLGDFVLARVVVQATRPAVDQHRVSQAPTDSSSPAWQDALSVVSLLA